VVKGDQVPQQQLLALLLVLVLLLLLLLLECVFTCCCCCCCLCIAGCWVLAQHGQALVLRPICCARCCVRLQRQRATLRLQPLAQAFQQVFAAAAVTSWGPLCCRGWCWWWRLLLALHGTLRRLLPGCRHHENTHSRCSAAALCQSCRLARPTCCAAAMLPGPFKRAEGAAAPHHSYRQAGRVVCVRGLRSGVFDSGGVTVDWELARAPQGVAWCGYGS
jgi:hypothetical protein